VDATAQTLVAMRTFRYARYIHLRPVHVDIDIDIHVLFSFLKDVRYLQLGFWCLGRPLELLLQNPT
jgi:hypothetical protein